jgi:Fe-S-cluster containining protein
VFLSENDVAGLEKFLSMPRADLIAIYCRIVSFGTVRRVSLKEKPNLDCIFWENDGCRVYEARPLQCSSFPFWSSSLASREEWEESTGQCPGIGKGRMHARREIEAWLRRRLDEGFIEG